MPENNVYQHTLKNGMTLLAERMEHVRSAAMNFLIPAGCAYDPPGQEGVAAMLADYLTRGAGDLGNRELTLALDNLGLDRSETVGQFNVRFWGATVARNIPAALELYADILCRPHFDPEEMEAVRALALQDLRSLEDEHLSRLMVELRKCLYPAPLSNDHRGTQMGVESVTVEQIRAQHARRFRPRGTILSVAGNVEWGPLRDQVERLFGDWEPAPEEELPLGPVPARHAHVAKDLEQTHIAVAYPSVPVTHPDYYEALGAVSVLSGGNMSSRLFTELREKQSLCYSVSASYQPLRDRANIFCYVGTRKEFAQRSLDSLMHELNRLPEGIEQDEVDRVKVSMKASMIMQQESTSSRAGMLASDWYFLGRVRTFDEIQSAIEALTPDSILAHVRRLPPRDFAIVTLGADPLAMKV